VDVVGDGCQHGVALFLQAAAHWDAIRRDVHRRGHREDQPDSPRVAYAWHSCAVATGLAIDRSITNKIT
jgi:hypothetical protein